MGRSIQENVLDATSCKNDMEFRQLLESHGEPTSVVITKKFFDDVAKYNSGAGQFYGINYKII